MIRKYEPDVWREIKRIAAEALEQSREDRPGFIERACSRAEVRSGVEELIRANQAADGFLDEGAGQTGSSIGHGLDDGGAARSGLAPEAAAIDRFVLHEKIGEGGFGEVFRAEQQEPIRRDVAIKILKRGMDSREVLRRFEAEKRALARLEHDGIARIYDGGETAQGLPFIAMELVQGAPLTTYCNEKSLPLAQRIDLFLAACDAVQYAHQRGLIHRDLKPSNLLVENSGATATLKVIDFGIAKVVANRGDDQTYTAPSQFLGTPMYMSPEQFSSPGDVDTRADVYALGAVLYELCSGARPFAAEALRELGPADLQRFIETEEPAGFAAQSAVPRELQWIIRKAMAKDRRERYESVGSLADDLRRWHDGEPVVAAPPGGTYRMRKFAARHRGLIGAVAATFAALAIGLAAAAYGLYQADQQRDRAIAAQQEAETQRDRAIEAEADAIAQRDAAESVTDFLQDMLAEADPAMGGGRDLTVAELLENSAVAIADNPPESPQVEAAVRQSIGRTLALMGKHDLAQPHLDEAVRLMDEVYGPTSFDALKAREYLVHNLVGAMRIDEAMLIMEAAEAKVDLEDERGAEQYARFLYLRASTRKNYTREYDEAEAELREAIDIMEELDVDPAFVARAEGELAIVFSRQGRHEEAEALLRAAIEDAIEIHGPRSAHVGGMKRNLGVILPNTGKFEESLALLRESVAITRDTHGAEHPATVSAEINYANRLLERGGIAEAGPMLEELLPRMERVVGTDALSFGYANITMSRYLMAVKRPADAIRYVQRGIEILSNTVGPRHEHTATAIFSLCRAQMAACDFAEARKTAELVVDIYIERFGRAHPFVAIAIEGLAEIEMNLNEHDEGRRRFQEAVDILATLGPRGLRDYAHTHSSWADWEMQLKNPSRAMELLEEAIATHQEIQPPDRRGFLRDRERRAECLAALGERETALERLREIEAELRELTPRDERLETRTANAIADLSEAPLHEEGNGR